jgi:RimJ/RimL family protein N-acetyltransferase
VENLPLFALTGASVALEPLGGHHLAGLVDAATEDRSSYTYTWVPEDQESMTDKVLSLIADHEAGECVPFVVVDDGGTVLGMTRFLRLDRWADSPLPSVAEIGGTWLRGSAQGTGANRESKILMLDHAFSVWGVYRVSFQTDERNERSRKSIESLGARLDGVQRAQRLAADGRVRNTAWYSILRTEWSSVPPSGAARA